MFKKILFFQPRTNAIRNYINAEGKEQRWVPWFALALAPAARLQGYEVELLDARVKNSWKSKIASLGSEDILAVNVITGNAIYDAIDASKIAQGRGAFILWGGPHVTLFPHETLEESPADAIITGFGFFPFFQFLSLFRRQEQYGLKKYSNILFKALPDFTFFKKSTKGMFKDRILAKNNEIPKYDLNLVADWEPYLNNDIAIASETINFITSEGCKRNCTFCSEPRTSNRKWLTRSITQVVETASDLIKRSNANGLKLHDPNFFYDPLRSISFAENFYRQVKIPWAATMHPEDLIKISDEDLKKFASYGLHRVLIGLESPIHEIIKLSGKRFLPSQIPKMVKRLATAGIQGMFTFIVGWPGVDKSHYDATINCAYDIQKIWPKHQVKIHFLEPWPGTAIYRLLIKGGFSYPTSLKEWAKIDYYQAQFDKIHDISIMESIHHANKELSPYVSA